MENNKYFLLTKALELTYFFNKTKQIKICATLKVASNFFSRAKGLLGTSGLNEEEALHIIPCKQIHMFGMKYAIDVIFIDKNYTVVGLVESIGPGKVSPFFANAYSCIELAVGGIKKSGVSCGDILELCA